MMSNILRGGGGGEFRISPFPVPKYQLIKSRWKVRPKGKALMYRYVGDSIRVAYVHCKNAGPVHISYGHDYDLLFMKFTLKGHSILTSNDQKSKLCTDHCHFSNCKYCAEMVADQSEYESITLAFGLDWIHRYQKEIENSTRFRGSLYNMLRIVRVKPMRLNSLLSQVVGQLQKIISPYFFNETYLILKIKEIFYLQCAEIDGSFNQENGIQKEIGLLVEFVDYIEGNFLHIANLSSVYEVLGCSSAAVNSLIKPQLGLTPKEFLTRTKMRYAKEQLKSGAMNASELSYALHYSTPNHFSRAFKGWYGYSPTQLKKGGI